MIRRQITALLYVDQLIRVWRFYVWGFLFGPKSMFINDPLMVWHPVPQLGCKSMLASSERRPNTHWHERCSSWDWRAGTAVALWCVLISVNVISYCRSRDLCCVQAAGWTLSGLLWCLWPQWRPRGFLGGCDLRSCAPLWVYCSIYWGWQYLRNRSERKPSTFLQHYKW